MIALLCGVATTLLSSTLNIVAARTEVQESDPSLSCFTSALIFCPDVFWKRGIELRRTCCSREGSDPRCVSARKQFWDVHRVQEPDSIVHELLEYVNAKCFGKRLAPSSISTVDVSCGYCLAGSAWSLVLIECARHQVQVDSETTVR